MQPSLPSAPTPSRRKRTAAAKRLGEPDAKARLIKAGAQLFCRHGINATGVDAIIGEAGTAKATLYKIFGSKEGLVEAVLQAEGQAWREWFFAEIDALPGSPAERLVGLFDVLKVWFEGKSFYGCSFINAVGEHDKTDKRIRNTALQHKRAVLGKIEQLSREAGIGDPDALTHQIALLMDGAIVAALVTLDPQVADAARRAAQCLVQAQSGRKPSSSTGRRNEGKLARFSEAT